MRGKRADHCEPMAAGPARRSRCSHSDEEDSPPHAGVVEGQPDVSPGSSSTGLTAVAAARAHASQAPTSTFPSYSFPDATVFNHQEEASLVQPDELDAVRPMTADLLEIFTTPDGNGCVKAKDIRKLLTACIPGVVRIKMRSLKTLKRALLKRKAIHDTYNVIDKRRWRGLRWR